MLLFCCYTPAHEVLYRDIFRPSVPPGFRVCAQELAITGAGDFLSPEFLSCIRKKIDLVVRSIDENPGRLVVWSDVDIRFFRLSPGDLESAIESSRADILFQRESPRMSDVNTGFFVCRCGPTVREFFSKVRDQLGSSPGKNEQMVVNRLLQNEEFKMENAEWGRRKGGQTDRMGRIEAGARVEMGEAEEIENGHRGGGNPSISWDYLPGRFYARTQGWPPPLRLAIYHANYTKGAAAIRQKLAQFREIKTISWGGMLAWAWSVIKRIPNKLFSKATTFS